MDERTTGLYKDFENKKISFEVKKKEREKLLKYVKKNYGINSIEHGLKEADKLSGELEELSEKHALLLDTIEEALGRYEVID